MKPSCQSVSGTVRSLNNHAHFKCFYLQLDGDFIGDVVGSLCSHVLFFSGNEIRVILMVATYGIPSPDLLMTFFLTLTYSSLIQ